MAQDMLSTEERMTEQQLIEYWGISIHTLRKWRTTGRGPMYIKIGGKAIYPMPAIHEYERSRLFRGSGKRVFIK